MTHAERTQDTQTSALPDAELPEGWCVARLDDLLQPGGLFDGPFGSNLMTADYSDSGVRVVRLENLSNLRFVEDKRTYIPTRKYADLKKHTVAEGDILFGSFVEGSVRVCILPRLDTPAIAKADCFCIRPPTDLINRRFLVFQLASSSTRDALLEGIHGATRPRINTRQLRELNILLAPMAEQNRIAAQVEALLARVKAARERLDNVPAILKRFRQSVLAAACSGRLTEDWRQAHRVVEETPSLLKRIGGTIVQELTPNVFSHLDDAALFDLPETWSWASLGSLGKWSGGGTPSKDRSEFWNNGTMPWVTPKDMKIPQIGDSQDHITETGVEAARLKIAPPGSLLMVVRGMILAHTFPVAITTGPVTVNQDMRVLQPHDGRMGPFLLLALQQASGKLLNEVKESTHGTKRVESEALLNFPIAIPPLEEEIEIVRRVDGVLRYLSEVEKQLASGKIRAEKLTQAILAKAFRGELVPTEAELARREGREYESAAALLARISTTNAPTTSKPSTDGPRTPRKRTMRVR
jgi:type I restriction enzyme, S subunit